MNLNQLVTVLNCTNLYQKLTLTPPGRKQMKPVVPLNSRQADDPQLPDLLPSHDALPPPTTDDPLHHPVVLPLFAAPPYHPVARRLPLVDLHPGTTDTHHLVDGAALPDGGPQGGFLLGAEWDAVMRGTGWRIRKRKRNLLLVTKSESGSGGWVI